MELSPAVAAEKADARRGVGGVAFGAAVGVSAVARLELLEVSGREGAVLLGDAWHIGPAVVNPSVFRTVPLREEDDVGLHAGAVGRERAAREAQDRVEVAILRQNLEHLAGLVREQAVVGENDGGATAGLEDRQDVLDEVELL